MSHPCISIVIPSYNQGAYFEQAIQSVLGQDYTDIELIVVDGASQDNSPDIIHKYAPRLAWWVSEPDQGQSHAINKGFGRTTGEIITFLSADDYYLPGTFSDVADRFRRNPGVGAVIGAFAFLEAGATQPGEPILPFLDGSSPVDLSLGPPGKYRLHQVATFYSRDALDAVGRCVPEDMRYVMDRELLYRVCRQFPLALSRATYGVFRRHPKSKSATEILPFAREFSRLYESSMTGEPEKDRLRQRMARYRLARGYLKAARARETRREKLGTMIEAARTVPEFVFNPSGVLHWLRLIFQPS